MLYLTRFKYIQNRWKKKTERSNNIIWSTDFVKNKKGVPATVLTN